MMTLYLNQEHDWCMSLLHKSQEKGRENRKSLFSSLTAAEVTEVGCELISMYLLLGVSAGAMKRVLFHIHAEGRAAWKCLKEWCRLCAGICRYGCSAVCLALPFLLLPPPISISSSHPSLPHLLLPCLLPFFLLAPSSRLPYISVSSLPPLFALTH